jgi:hypothetical protein
MRILLKKVCLTIFSILTSLLLVSGQTRRTQVDPNKFNQNIKLKFDTSQTAIISLDRSANSPFGYDYTAATLTQTEIKEIDSLVMISVTDYNKSLKLNFDTIEYDISYSPIDITSKTYKRQLVAVKNTKGQKEVWVNYFCSTGNYNWKRDYVAVQDGGSCYFNFKINLKTKRYYDFNVNGDG